MRSDLSLSADVSHCVCACAKGAKGYRLRQKVFDRQLGRVEGIFTVDYYLCRFLCSLGVEEKVFLNKWNSIEIWVSASIGRIVIGKSRVV